MKQFLLDKLNNFNQESLSEFSNRITKTLPAAGNPSMMWGEEETGVWYLDSDTARFYEDGGIIHIIDSRRNKEWNDTIKQVFDKLADENNTEIRITVPLEFEEVILENDSHPHGLVNGQVMYYNKLQTPTGEYGIPQTLDILLKNTPSANPKIREDIYKMMSQGKYIFSLMSSNTSNDLNLEEDNDLVLRGDTGYFWFIINSNLELGPPGNDRGSHEGFFDSSDREYIKYVIYEKS